MITWISGATILKNTYTVTQSAKIDNETSPCTPKADCQHGLPVVTGMFNSSDVITSFAEPLAKILFQVNRNALEGSEPNKRSDSEQIMLILLDEHSDPRWKKGLERLLKTRDEWAAIPGHE